MTINEDNEKDFTDDLVPMPDIETCSMSDFTKYQIDRLSTMHLLLNEEERLCCELGCQVVSEFKFRGDLASVRAQLKALIEYRKIVPYGEHDRFQVINEKISLQNATVLDHAKNKEFHSHLQNQPEYSLESMISNFSKLNVEENNYRNYMHQKGDCICVKNILEK